MINFSMAYKNVFKQMLNSHGYNIWKGFFYKDVDDVLFLFFRLRKRTHSPINATVEACVGFFPYFLDTEKDEFFLEDCGFDLLKILQRIAPEKMTPEHFKSLLIVNNDEAIVYSIELFSDDIETYILPYFKRLNNLAFLYSELIDINKGNMDLYTFGLSLKMHKYEDTLVYVSSRILHYNNLIRDVHIRRSELNAGSILSINLRQRVKDANVLNAVERKMLRGRPKEEVINSQIRICGSMIEDYENEIDKLNIVKEAILTNDHAYLDKLVEETEARSRAYLQQMLS